MPYHVEREKSDGTWETLFSEDSAAKADLLMMGLSIRTYPGLRGQHIDSSGLRVRWDATADPAPDRQPGEAE